MDLVECVQELYTISQTKTEFEELRELNFNSINLLQEKIYNSHDCTIGERRNLESALSLLLSYNIRIADRLKEFITEGTGLHDENATAERGLQWQEVTYKRCKKKTFK